MKLKSFAKTMAALTLTFTLFVVTGCGNKDNSTLGGTWSDSNGSKITFSPEKGTALFDTNGKKVTYKYRTRREYKFMVQVYDLVQYGMNMGPAYEGEELQFGTLYLNADGKLEFNMSEGLFYLEGGEGKTVETLNGLWITDNTPEIFKTMELSFEHASSEFILKGVNAESPFADEDGNVLVLSGAYRTVPFSNLIFTNTSDENDYKGMELILSDDDNVLYLDGTRFVRS